MVSERKPAKRRDRKETSDFLVYGNREELMAFELFTELTAAEKEVAKKIAVSLFLLIKNAKAIERSANLSQLNSANRDPSQHDLDLSVHNLVDFINSQDPLIVLKVLIHFKNETIIKVFTLQALQNFWNKIFQVSDPENVKRILHSLREVYSLLSNCHLPVEGFRDSGLGFYAELTPNEQVIQKIIISLIKSLNFNLGSDPEEMKEEMVKKPLRRDASGIERQLFSSIIITLRDFIIKQNPLSIVRIAIRSEHESILHLCRISSLKKHWYDQLRTFQCGQYFPRYELLREPFNFLVVALSEFYFREALAQGGEKNYDLSKRYLAEALKFDGNLFFIMRASYDKTVAFNLYNNLQAATTAIKQCEIFCEKLISGGGTASALIAAETCFRMFRNFHDARNNIKKLLKEVKPNGYIEGSLQDPYYLIKMEDYLKLNLDTFLFNAFYYLYLAKELFPYSQNEIRNITRDISSSIVSLASENNLLSGYNFRQLNRCLEIDSFSFERMEKTIVILNKRRLHAESTLKQIKDVAHSKAQQIIYKSKQNFDILGINIGEFEQKLGCEYEEQKSEDWERPRKHREPSLIEESPGGDSFPPEEKEVKVTLQRNSKLKKSKTTACGQDRLHKLYPRKYHRWGSFSFSELIPATGDDVRILDSSPSPLTPEADPEAKPKPKAIIPFPKFALPPVAQSLQFKELKVVSPCERKDSLGTSCYSSFRNGWLFGFVNASNVQITLGNGLLYSFDHEAQVSDLSFNSRGTLLATACRDGFIYVWSTQNGNLCAKILNDTGLTKVGFSEYSQWIVTTDMNNRLRIWSWHNCEPKCIRDYNSSGKTKEFIWRCDYPEKFTLITIGENEQKEFFDVPLQNPKLLACVDVVSKNGEWGADIELNSINIYSMARSIRESKLDGHRDLITGIEFSPDSRLLATACFGSRVDMSILLWKLKENDPGFELAHKLSHDKPVSQFVFDPRGHYFATVDIGHNVRIWELSSGNLIINFENQAAPKVEFISEANRSFVLIDGKKLAIPKQQKEQHSELDEKEHLPVEQIPIGQIQGGLVQQHDANAHELSGESKHDGEPQFAVRRVTFFTRSNAVSVKVKFNKTQDATRSILEAASKEKKDDDDSAPHSDCLPCTIL